MSDSDQSIGSLTISATEQAYYDLWSASDLDALSPTALAERGGRLADRAAWVFVGAYQGAMRQAFGQVRAHVGWASYLVSEARDETRAPTCTLEQHPDGWLLQGTKSWVAARPHLATLVINATLRSGKTANVLVPVATAGVALLEKPAGRFLPELAVGEARFDQVVLPASAMLTDADTNAALFGLIEARCLLVALAAHFSELAPTMEAPAQALLLAGGLTTSQLGQQGSLEVLLEAMTLLADWFTGWLEDGPDSAIEIGSSAVLREVHARWADDRRLLEMHRPMLQKRLDAYNVA